MKDNCNRAIQETLKWEGGYCNHPSDPGGPTNYGITIAVAQQYWKKDATAQDMKTMPKSIAVDIYRSKYWVNKYYNCDNLPLGVDLTVYDFGVNSGPARAKRYVDMFQGLSPEETINKICDERLKFLKGLKTWGTFGKGWTRRVEAIRAKSLEMARGKKPIQPVDVAVVAGTGAVAAVGYNFPDYLIHLGFAALVLGGAFFIYKLFKKRQEQKNNVG